MNYKSVFLFFKHFIKFEWEIRYIRCLRQHSITTNNNKAYSQKVRIGIHTKSMDVILTKKEKKRKKK